MKKRYGQHFISDRNILQKIVRLAGIQPSDLVVEIGPGAGSLTRELATVARRVVAIEIDADLIPALRAAMPANVEIVEGDALSIDLGAVIGKSAAHVVGNLPYNVATPLLRRFIAERSRITEVTVMMQKEVAERVRAAPGSKDYGPLSVLVQYYASPAWGFMVPPGAFTPRPKVDSAVIRFDWKPGVPDALQFTDFVHKAFASRRKKLLNNLMTMFPQHGREVVAVKMESAGVGREVRAETLSVEQFLRVYNRFQ